MVSRLLGRRCYAQSSINAYYEPPEFLFADRYAYMLKIAAMVLVFAPAVTLTLTHTPTLTLTLAALPDAPTQHAPMCPPARCCDLVRPACVRASSGATALLAGRRDAAL